MRTRRINKDNLKNICICEPGQEVFQNGIFKFNISAILEDTGGFNIEIKESVYVGAYKN